jgi:hypothetical protein
VSLVGVAGIWRVYGKRLKQGVVIVGTREEPGHADIDSRLRSSLQKYGQVLLNEKAFLNWIGSMPWDVEFAVLDNKMNIVDFYGGIPLRLKDPTRLMQWNADTKAEAIGGRSYIIGVRRLAKKPPGLILIPWDVSPEQKALGENLLFGAGLGAAFAVLTLVVVALIERRRYSPVSLEDALTAGEGETIEFKESLSHRETLRTVAAFMNSRRGGSLFIGVSNAGRVKGLANELRSNDARDKFELDVRNLVKDKMRKSWLQLIQILFHDRSEGTVCQVFVEPSPTVVFLRIDSSDEAFFVRAGNQTIRVTPSEMLEYVRGGRRYLRAGTKA